MPLEQKFISLDPAKLKKYAGKYQVADAPDIVITVSVQEGKLVTQVQGQSIVMQPQSETNFSTEDGSMQIVFTKDQTGLIPRLVFNGQFNATKLKND